MYEYDVELKGSGKVLLYLFIFTVFAFIGGFIAGLWGFVIWIWGLI